MWLITLDAKPHLLGPALVAAFLSMPSFAAGGSTVAIWHGEVWQYGIVSTGTPEDSLKPFVSVYSDPGDSSVIDSLQVGTAVKYRRLSEIERIAPITLLHDSRFRGEWFRIELPDTVGWLYDKYLMTAIGIDWGRDPGSITRTVDGGHIFIVYTSGQFWVSQAMALAYWEFDQRSETWILRDVLPNAISCGLYMGARIDSVVSTSLVTHSIFLTSIGGDAGDIWGERVMVQLAERQLRILKRESFNESVENTVD